MEPYLKDTKKWSKIKWKFPELWTRKLLSFATPLVQPFSSNFFQFICFYLVKDNQVFAINFSPSNINFPFIAGEKKKKKNSADCELPHLQPMFAPHRKQPINFLSISIDWLLYHIEHWSVIISVDKGCLLKLHWKISHLKG